MPSSQSARGALNKQTPNVARWERLSQLHSPDIGNSPPLADIIRHPDLQNGINHIKISDPLYLIVVAIEYSRSDACLTVQDRHLTTIEASLHKDVVDTCRNSNKNLSPGTLIIVKNVTLFRVPYGRQSSSGQLFLNIVGRNITQIQSVSEYDPDTVETVEACNNHINGLQYSQSGVVDSLEYADDNLLDQLMDLSDVPNTQISPPAAEIADDRNQLIGTAEDFTEEVGLLDAPLSDMSFSDTRELHDENTPLEQEQNIHLSLSQATKENAIDVLLDEQDDAADMFDY